MKKSRIHPREDQVAELTRGQKLPLPPLDEIHLSFIAETLARAWNELVHDCRSTMLSGDEAEVNSLMETRLIGMLEEDKRWSQLVQCIAKGKETVSFDGSHLEKRPDLSIYLTARTRLFPLIVECKLIDLGSGRKVQLYCDDGLTRFVRGDYAWATREAFMLAYVRDGSTIPSTLEPFLLQHRAQNPDPYLTQDTPRLLRVAQLHLARSTHDREFHYMSHSGANPGAIAIWHLWTNAGSVTGANP